MTKQYKEKATGRIYTQKETGVYESNKIPEYTLKDGKTEEDGYTIIVQARENIEESDDFEELKNGPNFEISKRND